MALAARDNQRAVERTAAAGLDGVAEHRDIARLAQDAVIENLTTLGRPFQQLYRAVDRDAFLVAGDEQRERAFFRLAAVGGKMLERSGDETSDAALHIDCAAPIKRVARDVTAERRMPPCRLVARRHHVGVPGEHQIRPCVADAGIKVVDRRGAGLGEGGTMHGKSRLRECLLQISERPALCRRHRPAADEIAGNRDGIGAHGLQGHELPLPARFAPRNQVFSSGSGPYLFGPGVPRRKPSSISTARPMTPTIRTNIIANSGRSENTLGSGLILDHPAKTSSW